MRKTILQKGPLMKLQVRTFKTREQAMKHMKDVETPGIQYEREYDPEDPNADETGHVWVVSVSSESDSDKLYLCTDGSIR